MKTELNPAFVLHHRPYRETSSLLDVFSRDHGRISLIAKGIRKKGSARAGLLQPWQRLQIAWSGKSELMTLTDVEADGPPRALQPQILFAGFYLNELIIRMLHQHEAHPDLFDSYDNTLGHLSGNPTDSQPVIRIFEKRLLDATGYGLTLDHDVDTDLPLEPDSVYYYQADRGPSVNLPKAHDYIKISGRSLLDLGNEVMQATDVLRETRDLLRYVLRKHLGPKPLASRKLYQSFLANSRVYPA